MKYLLVNHIAAHAGRDAAHVALPRAWARDLLAAGRAAQRANVTLIVATPLSSKPAPADSVEIVPDAAGFEHVVLPGYDSARSFLRERQSLDRALVPLVSRADVVQLDHGGHPIPLGTVVDPIATAAGTPRLWVIGGDRLPDSRLARSAGTVAKRLAGRSVVDARVRHSLIDALRSADGIIACSGSAAEHLRRDWQLGATIEVPAIDLIDDEVIDEETLAGRTHRLAANRPLRLAVVGEQTIARGTDHVLRAMHRCWRLRVPTELVVIGDGSEVPMYRQTAHELGLDAVVRFTTDLAQLATADVLIDPSLTDAAHADLTHATAAGLAPIAYGTRLDLPHVLGVARGHHEDLAAELFEAALKRASLTARMHAGVDWARGRTLDRTYRQRFEIAAGLTKHDTRGAA